MLSSCFFNQQSGVVTTMSTGQTDWARSAYPSFHRIHHSIELDLRLCKRNSDDPDNDLLVSGWYEAVVCSN